MSNPEQEAAANIRKLLSGLRGLVALEPGLESLGSVKQAESEVRSRLITLQKDEQQIRTRVAAAEDAVAAAIAKATKIENDAAAVASQIKGTAQTEADQITKEAKASADGIVAAARTRASDMDASLAGKRNVLNDLNREIGAAQTRLDGINSQIADLRKKF